MSEDAENNGIFVSENLRIPEWELGEQFIRAGGPGGQNVNKVATAVQLRWNVAASSLPADVKARFAKLWASRLTADGDVVVEAKAHRRQGLNRAAARKRLADMVRRAATPPKRRVKTRPPRRAVEQRIDAKKRRGAVKAARAKPTDSD